MSRFVFPPVLAALLAAVMLAPAQLPSPRLLGVSPPGGKIGTMAEVAIHGTALEDSMELLFSHPGITAKRKSTNVFEITIATNVQPGTYDLRASGANGVTNPRAFAVGLLDEILETNNSSENPQKVALESTITGRTEPNTIDYFRFHAKRGQRVLVRCAARAIDSKLEPVLSLSDSASREVARSRSGGLLDYSVVQEGEFTVRLHDAMYRGGTEFFYRLSVGTFPHIDYVLPIGGERGEKFAIFGRNLPGGKSTDSKHKAATERLEIEIMTNDPALTKSFTTMPAQAGLDLFEYRLHNDRGASDTVLVRFPQAPVVLENEPNNASAAAQEIAVPCELMGQFDRNGDRDWFIFKASKGDVYWIEVVSHRLGAGTDPAIVVRRFATNGVTDSLELNDSEPNFGGAEFNTAHRDPAGRFEVKETGTYLIQVRDLFTHPQQGAGKVYHLAVRKPFPDYRLVALPGNPLPAKKDAKDIGVTATTLRRGETLPMKIVAFRRDGFDGAIDVGPAEFPDGVLATSCRIESGKNSALLFLTAEDDATTTITTGALRGSAFINNSNISRIVAPATVVWGTADPAVDAAMVRTTAEATLSVREDPVPVRVRPESNVIETIANRTVKVNFLIDRRKSSAGSVKLKPFGLAALDSVTEVDVSEKETNLVLQIDLREKKVPAGTHVFALQVSPQAKAAADKSKKPKDPPPAFYSSPVVLRVAAPASTNSAAK